MIIEKIENDLISAKTQSGIFLFKLGICLYIVDGLLIDTGSAAVLEKTKSLIKQEKINCVAITHVHEDHTGAASMDKGEPSDSRIPS